MFHAPVDLLHVLLVVSLVPPVVFHLPPQLPAVLGARVPASTFLDPKGLARPDFRRRRSEWDRRCRR